MKNLFVYCVFLSIFWRFGATFRLLCPVWARLMEMSSCPSELASPPPCIMSPLPPVSRARRAPYTEIECGVRELRGTLKIADTDEVQDISEFPWMGALMQKNSKNERFVCATVIISDRYVLTAAHCVYERDPNSLYITFGDADLKMDGENESDSIDVQTVIPHDEYNPLIANNPHDIALLQLKKSIQFSDSVKPICIPQFSIDLGQQKVTIAGWQAYNSSNNSPAVRLKKVVLPIIEFAQCQTIYQKIQLDDTKLCTGYISANENGSDLCKSDSGGPVMWHNPIDRKFYVVGVISSGGCGLGVGLETNILPYIDWIRAIIA